MKIPKIVKIGALIATGIAVSGEGGCIARQIYRNEPVDRFVKSIDTGIVEPSKNFRIDNFTKSLIENKSKIQQTIDISDKDYYFYSKLAIGIAKEETLFGLGEGYCLKKNTPIIAQFFRTCAGKTPSSSMGLTNLKIDDLGNAEKKILAQLGVTSKNIFNPEKSAIATIVHLSFLNRDYYNKYLKKVAPKQENPLTREEYITARWKGFPKYATILFDRTAKTPKDYTWKVLHSINCKYDNENCCVKEK